MSQKLKTEPSTAGPSRMNEMAYDPDQDPEERRGVRKDYRSLQTRFDGIVQHFTINVVILTSVTRH